MKINLTNDDILIDAITFADESIWIKANDIADDDLCDSLGRQDRLHDEEHRLSCDVSDAVDSYFQRTYGARRLRYTQEVW